jgi:myo-inositol-1(or 4)-monophosphatase
MKDLLLQLSTSIRETVRPWALDARGGEVVGRAHSGDATFKIDEIAEKNLDRFLKQANQPIACFSEDRGLVMPRTGSPEWLLVVDPVDGSRNAKSGFEACMVSIALAKYSENPTLADVTHALLHEIVGERVFYAERNAPVEIMVGKELKEPVLSDNDDLDTLRWSMTIPGRPASLIFGVMADLIDQSSVRGGFFSCNSTCYSISRIVTGQLDAYVDVANCLVQDFPLSECKEYGCLTGFSSYDIAAALLIAKQAGVTITDGYGDPLDDMLLLDTSPDNLGSCVAASTRSLHAKIMRYIENHRASFEPS